VNKAAAEKIGHYVDQLNAAKISGMSIDRHAAMWLAEIGDTLRTKLERAGLVEPLEPVEPEPAKSSMLLKDFLQSHLEARKTARGEMASDSTLLKWNGTMRFLNQVFPGRTVDSFTHEDGHNFREWLDKRRIKKTTSETAKGVPMAENAKRKHVDNAKVFFNAAKRRGLIVFNPFEYQVSSTRTNRARDFFLTRDQTEKILSACPDAEWRLLVALWRYAGLRKMEVFRLTWGDVLWNDGKMRVHAPKTEHHEGKDVRYVGLRDIRPHLADVFQEQLPDGKRSLPADAPIVTRFSKSNCNLDKPFKVILHKAGIVPWPKLFQNMRASCETEWLNEGHPAHVVAAMIGHSVKVQRASYAQITDGHFDAFNSVAKSGALCGAEDSRNEEKAPTVAHSVARLKTNENAENQCFSYSKRSVKLPEAGLEPTSKNTAFRGTSDGSGALCGALTRFCRELQAAGFSAEQIRQIDSAMLNAGLRMVAETAGL